MARLQYVLILLGFLAAASALAGSNEPLRLWYCQPAAKWTEALPLGNGRMGAMVFGGVGSERVQFNEDTLWKGQPHDYVRAGAREQLGEIRRLVAEGKTKDAEKLAREKFLSDPVRQKAYQPFGDLRFEFPGQENFSDYRRELDLDAAPARVSYSSDGVTYKREAFASFPDQAVVLRFTASQPGRVSFTLRLDSPHTNSQTAAIAPETLALTGQIGTNGLRFEARVCVLATGGQTVTNGNSVSVQKADAVTVLLTAATSFKNFQDISGDPAKRCGADLAKARKRSFEKLLAAHLADYRALFERVSLDLGRNGQTELPTDQRLPQVKNAGLEIDPALAALEFQYGRYLLISSSRPGSQPANLQGVWNELLEPPWESKWINCQMNYWPAEVANLSECHEPLFDMIDDLVISGGRTAQSQYGCRGWVLHHNTDLWRGTAPINNIDGIWPTGGAWLCYHLWEHYLFTRDRKFLARRAYPAMKQACLFFMDYLVADPKTGWLVTTPSFSPEQGTMTAGPTMDEHHARCGGHPEKRFRVFGRVGQGQRPAGSEPDRQTRPVTGVAGGHGCAEQQSPAHVSALGAVSRRRHQPGRPEDVRGRQAAAPVARGRQHRMELRLAHPALGAGGRRGFRLPPIVAPASETHVAEPVRPVRAVPNRRQFRGRGGRRGNAGAESVDDGREGEVRSRKSEVGSPKSEVRLVTPKRSEGGSPTCRAEAKRRRKAEGGTRRGGAGGGTAAGVAQGVAGGERHRAVRAGRLRGGPDLEQRGIDPGRDSLQAGPSLPRARRRA